MFLIRVRSIGFFDVHDALSMRKGTKVVKSSLGYLFTSRGAIFYRV